MTNPAILEALADAIRGACNGTPDAATEAEVTDAIAAAVLDLVGPKPLVWQSNIYGDATAYVAHHNGKKYVYGVDFEGEFYAQTPDGETDHPTIEAAQSAAQAYADAAHWANTALGAMIGGE